MIDDDLRFGLLLFLISPLVEGKRKHRPGSWPCKSEEGECWGIETDLFFPDKHFLKKFLIKERTTNCRKVRYIHKINSM
jgi:hypothetical protein